MRDFVLFLPDRVGPDLSDVLVQHFDRDPRTNELLWFSGPPIQRIDPEAFRPKYSLKYLAFLAKKQAAADKQREEEEEAMEMDAEEEDGGEARRKRLKIEESGKPVPPPTLHEVLRREFAMDGVEPTGS